MKSAKKKRSGDSGVGGIQKRDQIERLRNIMRYNTNEDLYFVYRVEEPIFRVRKPKMMELGLTNICTYSRHS